MVSDHGTSDSEQIFHTWNKKPPEVSFHALLLVKQFNSRGTLEVNTARSMNFDTRSIIAQQISNRANSKDLIKENSNRKRCSVLSDSWLRNSHPKNHFDSNKMICVHESLFEPNGWKSVKSLQDIQQ